MNDTLSHITIGQVALVGLVVAGVARFGGRSWSWARRAVHFVDKLESIERQVYANGGSSMRDAVDAIRSSQEQLATTQGELARSHEQLVEELAQVRTALEEHVQVSAREPRRQNDPPDVDYRPAGHGGI